MHGSPREVLSMSLPPSPPRVDAVLFQRRNRLKRHFVTTSNVLLYGYPQLSDAAKITYQVIDGFDWESKATGDSKGYVFPAVETLATIRHTTVRTIQRHLKELEAAQLLTRIRRQHQPSLLVIEDVSTEAATLYETQYLAPPEPATRGGESSPVTNDKTVVSRTLPETTKLSLASNKKENEQGKENEMNVNVDKKIRSAGQGSVEPLRSILMQYAPVRPLSREKTEPLAKRDYMAETLAAELNDQQSVGCYRYLATKIPHDVLFATLARVKELGKDGTIRTRPGAVFVDQIKRYAAAKKIALDFTRGGETIR